MYWLQTTNITSYKGSKKIKYIVQYIKRNNNNSNNNNKNNNINNNS